MHHEVVIVGGGVAGLSAARSLQQHGLADVCVVDACDAVGGRVQQVHGVAPWPLEAGPEFVHGSNSQLVHILRHAVHMKLEEKAWPNKFYSGRQRRLVGTDSSSSDTLDIVNHLMFELLPKEAIPQEDISVQQWLQRRGADADMLELADVCYANDFGTSLGRLGLTEAILEARGWDAGEEYLIRDRSFSHLVTYLAQGVQARVSWPVRRIEWHTGHGARICGPDSQVITCKHVVCAVPLSQLQAARIAFSPALSAAKQAALQRVHMGNAIKVWAVFSDAFWPEDTWDVVCPHCLIPEFSMCRYTAESSGGAALPSNAPASAEALQLHCVTGFVCGERAAKLSQMPEQQAVQLLVAQLDQVFGSLARPRPASSAFVRGAMVDWSRKRYFEGAYCSPSLGARVGDRGLLAQPQGDVLFFAGEHTHPGINPCLQAAMDTGDRAAAQVLRARALRKPVASKL